MDPFTNIARQRELVGEINLILDGNDDSASSLTDAAAELAELVAALDEWQAKGGFSPYPLNLPGVRITQKQLECIGIVHDDDRIRSEGDILITRMTDEESTETAGPITVSFGDGSSFDFDTTGQWLH